MHVYTYDSSPSSSKCFNPTIAYSQLSTIDTHQFFNTLFLKPFISCTVYKNIYMQYIGLSLKLWSYGVKLKTMIIGCAMSSRLYSLEKTYEPYFMYWAGSPKLLQTKFPCINIWSIIYSWNPPKSSVLFFLQSLAQQSRPIKTSIQPNNVPLLLLVPGQSSLVPLSAPPTKFFLDGLGLLGMAW